MTEDPDRPARFSISVEPAGALHYHPDGDGLRRCTLPDEMGQPTMWPSEVYSAPSSADEPTAELPVWPAGWTDVGVTTDDGKTSPADVPTAAGAEDRVGAPASPARSAPTSEVGAVRYQCRRGHEECAEFFHPAGHPHTTTPEGSPSDGEQPPRLVVDSAVIVELYRVEVPGAQILTVGPDDKLVIVIPAETPVDVVKRMEGQLPGWARGRVLFVAGAVAVATVHAQHQSGDTPRESEG